MCKILLVQNPPRLECCFPQSWKVLSSNLAFLQGQIPWRFPDLLSERQAGKPDVGFRTFTAVGELLWYYGSPVCGSPTWQGWGLTLLRLLPSAFSLWLPPCLCICGIFFWWVPASSCDGCSTVSCNFGAIVGGDGHTSFFSTLLNWKSLPLSWVAFFFVIELQGVFIYT